jgi:hypothetical protein
MATKPPKHTFIDRLKADSLPTSDLIVNEEVVLNVSNVNWEFRQIEGVTFKEKVEVVSVDIKCGLVFINCTFEKGIYFVNVKSEQIISEHNSHNCTLLFSKCTGSHLQICEKSILKRGLRIEQETKFNSINITASNLQDIRIKDSIVVKLIDIAGVVVNEMRFDKNDIKGNLRVGTFKGDITLISNKFGNWAKFWNVECSNSFTLNKNVFNDAFEIEASRINGLFIHEDTFEKYVKLENRDTNGNNDAHCNEIFITEAKLLEGADFNGLGKPINKITLRLSPGFEGVLNFEGWNVDDLQVSGINQNLKLLFKRMVFKFVLFNNFTNYADLSFDKCSATEDSPLHFLNTNLGTARFNEFDLASFSVIRIDNVSFDNIKTSNVKWFENTQLEIGSNPTEEDTQRGIREVSRQLKHALASSGNQIDSLLFKAREMQAYRNEMNTKGNKYSLPDRAIMSVNMSNNYGLSWWKPTWIILLITFGFYVIMLPLFSNIIKYNPAGDFADVSSILSELWDNFDVFWQMFNPARKFSSVYGPTDSGLLQFLDLFHRIILGIFIYQIIRGFRKLTMK